LVEDITPGCPDWLNSNLWWGSWYPNTANAFTNIFPELDGFNCGYNNNYGIGHFQYGRIYRITRAVWSDCDSWSKASAVLQMEMAPS